MNISNNNENSAIENAYEKAKNELAMLSEITSVIMRSLETDQVLYTILTALTSHEGMGFNRAMFFLVNEKEHTLEGKMGIGPYSAEEADKIWRHIETNKLTLQNLIDSYDRFKKEPESKLNSIVKAITIPLSEDTGILALTILEGMPFEINTNEAASMVSDKIKKLLNIEYFVTVPLKTRNKTLGAILVDNPFSRMPITKDNIRILTMFADHAALAIENSRLYEKTVHLSRTDWLTGLWNTRHFNGILSAKFNASEKEETSLSLAMIDIDNFKHYNDGLGHQEGDKAIRKIARILSHYSRKSDFVSRYGGEEFCIIMSKTNKNEAEAIAERMRLEVENCFKNDFSLSKDLQLTISLGIATFPIDSKNKNDLIKKADQALYQAKKQGKNRVSLFTPEI